MTIYTLEQGRGFIEVNVPDITTNALYEYKGTEEDFGMVVDVYQDGNCQVWIDAIGIFWVGIKASHFYLAFVE